jgi:hypothetical protein
MYQLKQTKTLANALLLHTTTKIHTAAPNRFNHQSSVIYTQHHNMQPKPEHSPSAILPYFLNYPIKLQPPEVFTRMSEHAGQYHLSH